MEERTRDPGRTTYDDLPDDPVSTRSRWGKRLGIGLLALIVVAAFAGAFGPRTETLVESDGPWRMTVTYPAQTRAGQPAPLDVFVEHPGGFDAPLALAICDEFFDDADFQNWYPNPAAETAEPGRVVYEFDPPPGDTFEVRLDARTAPQQFGEVDDCTVALLLGDQPLVDATFTVWRMP